MGTGKWPHQDVGIGKKTRGINKTSWTTTGETVRDLIQTPGPVDVRVLEGD